MPLDMSGHTELRTIEDLNTFLRQYDHNLSAQFGVTHLTAIADKISTAWGLKEDHEKITGQELIESLYDDLTSPHYEYRSAKDFINFANSLVRQCDYDTFKSLRERHIKQENKLPDSYNTVSESARFGMVLGFVLSIPTALTATLFLTGSAVVFPAMALPVIGVIAGAYIGSKARKHKINKLEQKKQKALSKIDAEFEDYKQGWQNFTQNVVDELLAPDFNVNNDEKQPRITFEPEAITRVRFAHRSAPSI